MGATASGLFVPSITVSGSATLTNTSLVTLVSFSPSISVNAGVQSSDMFFDIAFTFTSNETADNFATFGISINTSATIQYPSTGNCPRGATFSATSVMTYCRKLGLSVAPTDVVYLLCSLTLPPAVSIGASVEGLVHW